MTRQDRSKSNADAATMMALSGLLLAGGGLLGLTAYVVPGLLGIVLVVLLFGIGGYVQYVVWGRWLAQSLAEEDQAAEAEPEIRTEIVEEG
jgi:hypothetical protein